MFHTAPPLRFFVGLHQPSDARHFDYCCISINRIRSRKSGFQVGRWMMDSGAFTELTQHGRYRHGVAEYAAAARRWTDNGHLEAIVAQDYMCEPWVIEKTGLSVREHQRLTIARYDALLACGVPVPVMPVLQGYEPGDYARHVRDYGDQLSPGMWVGVGSVCKRNGRPGDIVHVLAAIKAVRGDLRLHGFGLKLTALLDPTIRSLLHSADSMAWSFAARRQGRNANDWREAKSFENTVVTATARAREPWQSTLPLEMPNEMA